MDSYWVKEFILAKHDYKYRTNVLLDMVEFERRFGEYILDVKTKEEDGHILVIYYIKED